MASIDLQPGTKVRLQGTDVVRTLTRRKVESEHNSWARSKRRPPMPFWPGWWCEDGSGLADDVIDERWVVIDTPTHSGRIPSSAEDS